MPASCSRFLRSRGTGVFSLAADIVESLSSCAGTLTAPAATLLLGTAALPALTTYATSAAANSHLGSDGYIAAASEHLGGIGLVAPTEQDRDHLRMLLAVTASIRG